MSDERASSPRTERDVLPEVLCVDDEPRILEALARGLRRHCKVTTAPGAQAAIRLIEAGREFSVVVCDLQMPAMDGIEFLRWVANNSPDTTGILLSGNVNLSTAITAVNAGSVFRFLTKPCPPADLIVAIRAAHERSDQRRAQRVLLSQAADQDPLTGLPDRRRFASAVGQMLEGASGSAVSLVVLALDDLELVRTTLGFVAVDEMLLAAARRLEVATCDPRQGLRRSILFRVDDRFALLWQTTGAASAEAITEQLLSTLESDVLIGDQRLRLQGHAGIVSVLDVDAMTALRNAEGACLAALTAGTPRFSHFSTSANDLEHRRLKLSQRLRQPRVVEELNLVYQPQWDLSANRLAGLEALARWQHPVLGAVSPAEFIPLIEADPHAAERLCDWVLRTACRQRARWQSILPDDVRVAVNISATDLRSGKLYGKVMRCLRETALRPHLLEIEITESAAIADLAQSDAQLQALRREGIAIAIDDFGIGFSSLSYLGSLPATSLKIDRTFIRDIDPSTRRADLLRGICGLGHAMQMTVVIEGVESLGLAPWLRAAGCDIAQGYSIARPLTPEAFEIWLATQRGAVADALAEALPLPAPSLQIAPLQGAA